jgi:hypothetical protein
MRWTTPCGATASTLTPSIPGWRRRLWGGWGGWGGWGVGLVAVIGAGGALGAVGANRGGSGLGALGARGSGLGALRALVTIRRARRAGAGAIMTIRRARGGGRRRDSGSFRPFHRARASTRVAPDRASAPQRCALRAGAGRKWPALFGQTPAGNGRHSSGQAPAGNGRHSSGQAPAGNGRRSSAAAVNGGRRSQRWAPDTPLPCPSTSFRWSTAWMALPTTRLACRRRRARCASNVVGRRPQARLRPSVGPMGAGAGAIPGRFAPFIAPAPPPGLSRIAPAAQEQ